MTPACISIVVDILYMRIHIFFSSIIRIVRDALAEFENAQRLARPSGFNASSFPSAFSELTNS